MTLLDQITATLKTDEGLRLHAYQDHLGFWTIGYGRLIDQRRGGGISEAEAEYLLRNDVLRVTADLARRRPDFETLPENVQAALVNMGFQLGVPGLMQFRNMWAAIDRRDWDAAADHALDSRWADQTPNRARRVTDLMRKGLSA